MGLRTGVPTPVNRPAPPSSPPTDHGAGDFDAAFAGLFDGDESTKEIKPNEEEGAEELEDEETEKENPPVVVEEPSNEDPIDKIEASAKAAREKWKLQKELKEAKAELEKLKADGQKGAFLDDENPLREITKRKGWSKDDIVAKALEAMEDDGMTEAEAKKEVRALTEEEIYEKVTKRIKEDQEAEREQNEKNKVTHDRIEQFKGKIKEFTATNSEKYPLVDGMGGIGHAYKLIEDDYMKNEEEYGVEYAQKNLMTIEKAVKQVNDNLASSVKNALKSDHVRKYILSVIKEDGGKDTKDAQLEDLFQLEDEEPQTLTNGVHRRSTDPKDSRELTDDERFEQAFSYLG
jgi:hypothetical protein